MLLWVYYDQAEITFVAEPPVTVPETSISPASKQTASSEVDLEEISGETRPADASPWTTLSQLPAPHKMPHIRADIQEKVLVKIERSIIENWQVEELVELPIPQIDHAVSVKIDTIDVLPSGNRSVIGHLVGEVDTGFIMTLGDRSIFATISTVDGIFNLRGNDDYAWVVSSRQLKRHLDPDIPDYRVPERDQK